MSACFFHRRDHGGGLFLGQAFLVGAKGMIRTAMRLGGNHLDSQLPHRPFEPRKNMITHLADYF